MIELADVHPVSGFGACAVSGARFIVGQLDDTISLVEFSDEEGCAFAIVPCPRTELLVLHYVPQAA